MRYALLLVTLLAVGCGRKPAPDNTTPGPEAPGGAGTATAKPADLIVGKWEPIPKVGEDQPKIGLEFTKDGKVSLMPVIGGTYLFTAEDVVVLTIPFAKEQISLKVKVTGDDLEATELGGEKKGQVTQFRRVAEFSEKYRTPGKVGGNASTATTPTAKLTEVTTFKGQEGAVNAVCFSPDGELVASGGDDKVVRVWKRATGDVVANLTGHQQKVMGLAWSPRGDLIASAGESGEVKLWAVPAWKEVPTKVNEGAFAGKCVLFGPAGDRLICSAFVAKEGFAEAGRGVRVWDIQADRAVIDLNHDRAVMGLAVSPDGRHLAATTQDGYAKVWELPGGKAVYSRKQDQTRGVAFSRDGKALAVGWNGVELLNWEEGGGAKGQRLKTRSSFPNHVAFLSDRTLAASFSLQPSGPGGMKDQFGVQVIDVRTGDPVAEAGGHAARIEAIAVSDDGKWLGTGGNDSIVKVWDISAYGTPRPKPSASVTPMPPAKTPDAPVAEAANDPPTNLPTFDPVKSDTPVVLTGHVGRVTSVAFSPDGERVAALACDQSSKLLIFKGEVAVWNVKTGRVDRRIPFDANNFPELDKARITFCPDGLRVAVATSQAVMVWDAATGRTERKYNHHVFGPLAVSYSTDGRRLVVAGEKPGGSLTVHTWDTETGKDAVSVDLKANLGLSGKLALSPDGTRVAVLAERPKDGTTAYRLTQFDCMTGKPTGTMDLPVEGYASDSVLNFDTAGRQVVVGLKGSVVVCDFQRGTARLLARADGVAADLAFSTEGNRVAVVGQKAVRVIDPATGKDAVPLPVAESPAWATIYDDHLKSPTTRSAFSPDGRFFAVGSGVTVQVWERRDGATKAVQKAPAIQARPEEKGGIEPKTGDVDRKDDAKLDIPVPLPKSNELPSQPVPETKKDTLPPPKEVR